MSTEKAPEGQVPKTVGFIGLGSASSNELLQFCMWSTSDRLLDMGWWMALNLRKKLPSSTKLFIYDIVSSILDNFEDNASTHGLGQVSICRNAWEITEKSVSCLHSPQDRADMKLLTGIYMFCRI